MAIVAGSKYEKDLVRESKQEIADGGLMALALICYNSSSKEPSERTKRDSFYAGLVYSEFLTDGMSDQELCMACDHRAVLCKKIGIDSFELYKMVENLYEPGRYK
jgi:hypothetical protein